MLSICLETHVLCKASWLTTSVGSSAKLILSSLLGEEMGCSIPMTGMLVLGRLSDLHSLYFSP